MVKITAGGWRPTRQNVEAMVLAVREKVERDDVVVLMGLDNGVENRIFAVSSPTNTRQNQFMLL